MTVQRSRIDLLRHGACEGGEIFRGSTDVALSEIGWAQMQSKIDAVDEAHWDRIISSPLQRCARFAERLAAQRQLPLSCDEALREIHFGDWEGLPHSEAQQRDPEVWRRFWESPEQASPPNGENMADFSRRVCQALDNIAEQYAGESVLLVVHGAVIRVMICHWLGMPMGAMTRLSVPYAGFSRFYVYRQPHREPWVQLHSHG